MTCRETAYHFLRADMTAGSGSEPPWKVGEKRTFKGKIELCKRGYHSSPSWYDALQYAPGPAACIVKIGGTIKRDTDKAVSSERRLIKAVNVERELRLFACDCTERALKRERKAGWEPDTRSWNAIKVARRFAHGKATEQELAAARDAAWNAVRDAAWAAARNAARDAAADAARDAAWAAAADAARDAARAAARDAARNAAGDAEINWQRQRLARYLNKALEVA